MRTNELVLESNVVRDFNVQKTCDEYGLDLEIHCKTEIKYQVPDLDSSPWSVGVIVGPSGSGKSTVARKIFGDNAVKEDSYAEDKAVISLFDGDYADVAKTFCSVGFGSVPCWVRPYKNLSNGEQFRVRLAGKFLGKDKTVVVDEFTSVIDRNVARSCCTAVSKFARSSGRKFVGVSCHYDILDWIEPDWVLDMSTGQCHWGLLRRKPLDVTIAQVSSEAWRQLKKFHYLVAGDPPAMEVHGAFVNGILAGVVVSGQFFENKLTPTYRINRLVVHPDYQGLGLIKLLISYESKRLFMNGFRVFCVSAHPIIHHILGSSSEWVLTKKSRENTKGELMVHSIPRRGGKVSTSHSASSGVGSLFRNVKTYFHTGPKENK